MIICLLLNKKVYLCADFFKRMTNMTIEDIQALIHGDETRTLELKKTTGELKDGEDSWSGSDRQYTKGDCS